MSTRNLPIQVRAYPQMEKRPRLPDARRPLQLILTFDTETSVDHAQRLHFGCFRLSTVRENDDGTVELFCMREGIFYDDDLDEVFPGGRETIEAYVSDEKYRHARIDNIWPSFDQYQHGQIGMDPEPSFEIMTKSEFIRAYIVGLCYTSDVRGTYREFEPATIVGFNLPFDMTRLGQSWSEGRKHFYRSFSIALTDWLRFKYKKSGAHGWYMELSGKTDASNPGEPKLEAYNLVDTATMVFALGGKLLSLRAAGEAFGCKWLKSVAEDGHGKITPEYIDYCRQDVRATEDLYRRVMEEWFKHPVSQTLKPDSAYSPASISKQYLRDLGIVSKLVGQEYQPIDSLPDGLKLAARKTAKATGGRYIHKTTMRRLAKAYGLASITPKGQSKLPPEVIARFMAGFFGGRSECRIRLTKVPAVLVDFTSMYPTVMILMRIWELLTCENLEIVEVDTQEIEKFLDSLNLITDSDEPGWETSLFNPAIWPHLTGVAETREGYLPIRSEYNGMTGSSPGIGINFLQSFTELPYTLLDLAASRIATGKVPPIGRAWMLRESAKRQASLRAVALHGNEKLRIDPSAGNLLKLAVEQRTAAKGRHLEYAALHALGQLDPVDPDCPCRDELRPCYDCARLMSAERKYRDPSSPTYGSSPRDTWEMLYWRIRNAHKDDNRRSVWSENRDKCLCPECVSERFLKVFANAIYGVFAEMNTPKVAKPKFGRVYGLGGQSWSVKNPEEPGEFCFPPFAALITSGARLMLAMLEKSVADTGGCHVFCDTDSLCIVASDEPGVTPDGIPIISYDQVNQIRERFSLLNPYDRAMVAEILKWESPKLARGQVYPDRQLYCVAISAKRYCLFYMNGDQPIISAMSDDEDPPESDLEIEKRSEHGLGLYLNPIPGGIRGQWYTETWQYILDRWIFGREIPEPDWFRSPAALRLTATSPDMLRAFRDFNNGWDYGDQVKPHNFMLSFTVSKTTRLIYPSMRLVTPYASPEELADWENLSAVYDIHGDGTALKIKPWPEMTNDELAAFLDGHQPEEFGPRYLTFVPDQPIPVKTYRDIIHSYVMHPEVKYDDANGKQCTGRTRGRLQPTTIVAEYVQHIGKTGNPFFNADKTLEELHYRDYDSERREDFEWSLTLRILPSNALEVSRQLAAMGSKESDRTIRRHVGDRLIKAKPQLRSDFMKLARRHATEYLIDQGFSVSELKSKPDFIILQMWYNRQKGKK